VEVPGLLDSDSRSGADGLIQDAINALEGALGIESFREDLLRRITALLAGAGRGAEALQRFDIFATYLDVELGVPPDDETAKLREEFLVWRFQSLSGTPRSRRADRPSVIVLPFDNLTREAWLTPLGRTMAEDMVEKLTRFRLLSCIEFQAEISRAAKRTTPGGWYGRYALCGSFSWRGDNVHMVLRPVCYNGGHHV